MSVVVYRFFWGWAMIIHFLEAAPFFAAQELRQQWLSAKEDGNWQYLFSAFGLSGLVHSIAAESKRKNARTESCTPNKKKKSARPDSEMSPPKSSTRPKKVGQCRAANFAQPRKAPETLARARAPIVTQQDGPFDPAADGLDPADAEDPETIKKADEDLRIIHEEPLVAQHRIVRRERKRAAKKVEYPSASKQLIICKKYFAEIGALWQQFAKVHHRQGLPERC